MLNNQNLAEEFSKKERDLKIREWITLKNKEYFIIIIDTLPAGTKFIHLAMCKC